MKRTGISLLVLVSVLSLVSCLNSGQTKTNFQTTSTIPVVLLSEIDIQEIHLLGPASEPRAEVSGMAWCGTNLVLLPQYPDRFSVDGSDHVFVIPERELTVYLSGQNQVGIEPVWIPFDSGELNKTIVGFEGFEAIVFNGKDFYVSIEARQKDGMMGYLVKGQIEGDCSGLVLDPDTLQILEPQADLSNQSHETLLVFWDRLFAIYEANGVIVNPDPISHVFALDLEARSAVEMVNIEYRITDATEVDDLGYFWGMNYFFPGDTELKPTSDMIAVQFGLGASHQNAETVERLVKFRISETGIQLAGDPPIYLELMDDDSRNWEGLVRFGDGFLLVTDKFPTTILAYVEAN